MQAKHSVAYGRGHLDFILPSEAKPHVIRKPPVPKEPDPKAAILKSLAGTENTPSLASLAHGKRSACIVVCDITRPVPNGLFLRPMIETLMHSGIPKEKISILIATGLHRPNLGAELAELIGDPWVLDNVRVLNHDARDDEMMADLGQTPTRQTSVKINRIFIDAELKIVTGLVEPHFMAGWSGGRKVIAPGIASQDTIRTFHNARFMGDPKAIQCNLDANPLHEEQLEIVKKIGTVYALNTVIDEDRDLVHVTFGEIIESHLRAVDFVKQSARVPVGRRFDTIVTSSAGYPLDKTYYQTIKGMVTPLDILNEGGTLIIASECSEGFGSSEFKAAQAALVALGVSDFLKSLQAKNYADVDEWQTQMQLKPLKHATVYLVTHNLSEAERQLTAVKRFDTIEEALALALKKAQDKTVAIIPEGPYLVPVVT